MIINLSSPNYPSFPDKISLEKVTLKKHAPELAETMFQYINEDRDRLSKFLPFVSAITEVQHERDFIHLVSEKWEKRELFDYGIFLANGSYVGNIGVHSIQWTNSCAELGYWIFGQFEGQGYVSEAVAGLTEACFQHGLNRVEIRCDPNNEKSRRVPSRLGFQLEGILRSNATDTDGRPRDTMVFARLKSDGPFLALKIQNRPDCIKHWSEILSPDNSMYPGSRELHSFGAPVGKATGLIQIGIHHEILNPGRRTSWPHAESAEEEFVYVVSGMPSAWINGSLYPLRPGDAVGFPAGTGIAHTFINNTELDAVLLVVGERNKAENKCIYPLHPDRNAEIGHFLWSDWPSQTMGLHDGLPDKLRSSK